MKRKSWVTVLCAVLAAVCAQAAGVKICFEAETAKEIEKPMAVMTNATVGASGTYLEIPEGAGNPPKLNAGKAVYSVDVPEAGNYVLWLRVWWNGECSNSFTISVDSQTPFLFGEDATYKVWHWVRYPVSRTARPIQLTAGKHTLCIMNREDGVRLDQILLSGDKRFVPVDIEKAGTR
jgi:hypothetical protein